jgi:DNA-binding GntR family transcriptional regulator
MLSGRRRRAAGRNETERVYLAIKKEILSSRLPGGTVLRQVELAMRLTTSRTPVREAIARLASEQLVVLSPGRGARVVNLSIRDFLEINQLRWLLEGFAARVAAALISVAEIDRANKVLSRLGPVPDVRALAQSDQMVHGLVARRCNNDHLRSAIEQLNGMMIVARMTDIEHRREETAASLKAIVAAFQQRDGNLAEELMQDHIRAFSGQIPLLFERTAQG